MINKFEKDGLYFIALGGADEIGMNMYVYACNGKFIMVDAGYGFLNDNYPGIDLCFADAGFFANYAEDFEGISSPMPTRTISAPSPRYGRC